MRIKRRFAGEATDCDGLLRGKMHRGRAVATFLIILGAYGISWSRSAIAARKRTTQSRDLIRSSADGSGFAFAVQERADHRVAYPTSVSIGYVYPHASGAYRNRSGSPPLHIHRDDDEEFKVLEGLMGYSCAGKEGVLKQGEAALLPRGSSHTFWNARPDTVLKQQITFINRSGRHTLQERVFEQIAAISYDHGGIDNVNPLQLILTLQAANVDVAAPLPVRLFIRFVVCPFAELLGYKGVYPEYVLP